MHNFSLLQKKKIKQEVIIATVSYDENFPQNYMKTIGNPIRMHVSLKTIVTRKGRHTQTCVHLYTQKETQKRTT